MMLMQCFFFLLIFFIKSIRCECSFELHRQVDAIQMGTHNICLYKVADKKYTGCDLKTTTLLDCGLIGACAVIRLNTVSQNYPNSDLIFLFNYSSYVYIVIM